MQNNSKKEVNFGPGDIGLEGDISKLGKEISDKKLSLESKIYSDKDLIRQNLQSMIYSQKNVAPQQSQKAEPDEDRYLPDYLKDAPQEIKNQVEKILEYTIKHGLSKGISEARKMPPFVLDAYHDALTDKMHDEMKKRHII